MANLIKSVEKYKNDPTTSKSAVNDYKRKINEYKAKVRHANELLAAIGAKIGSEGMDYDQEEIQDMIAANRNMMAAAGIE